MLFLGSRRQERKAAQEKKKQDAKRAAGISPKKPKTVGPAVLTFEPKDGRAPFTVQTVSAAGGAADVDFSEPVMFTGVLWSQFIEDKGNVGGQLSKEIEDFKVDFGQSDLRITAGRCQNSIQDPEAWGGLEDVLHLWTPVDVSCVFGLPC